MRNVGVLLALLALAVITLPGPALSADPDHRVREVARQLRCPFCKNVSAWDSDTIPAREMVADVRARLARGETDAAVLGAYEEMYGPWILMSPPRRGGFWIAWLTPFAVVVGGGGLLAWSLRRWMGGSGPVPSLAAGGGPTPAVNPEESEAWRKRALDEFPEYL